MLIWFALDFCIFDGVNSVMMDHYFKLKHIIMTVNITYFAPDTPSVLPSVCLLSDRSDLLLFSRSVASFQAPGTSLPGSSRHGISQARIQEWVVIPFSGGYSQPRDGTRVSCIGGGGLYH